MQEKNDVITLFVGGWSGTEMHDPARIKERRHEPYQKGATLISFNS